MSTNTATSDIVAQLPGKPTTRRKNMWKMMFRLHNYILDMVWEDESPDLPTAIARGRAHCEKMGYKFMWVRPFLVNLEEVEARKKEGRAPDYDTQFAPSQ